MYPGFEFNQGSKPSAGDYQQQHFSEQSKNFAMNPENKHIYNFKAPPFEEPTEGYPIPPQILELFESKDKATLENKNKVPSRTSVTSRSTVDSRAPSGSMNFPNPNVGGNVGGGTPIAGMNPSDAGMRFQSFNALLNQSNDFMMNKASQDLNTSNISNKDSRKMSINNISRDSIDLNTSSSRRNTSSRANPKTSKNYQVTLNEDISLIERIEIMLNQITINHNKACPFCSKIIDIKKCNFQNISAFLSNTSKKYYLTHFDCYLKSNSNPASAKIVPLSGIIEARVNSQINSLSNIDTSNFLRSDRRAYFVSIEGYHPISSYLFFKIDKICHGLEHATHRNQLLYLNFASKSTSIFEPSSYMIPFNEFRLVITIHMSHANEDPFTYEYLVDFSQVKLSADQKNKFAEVLCLQDGNNILIATQIVYDPNAEFSKANLETSFQSTGSTTSSKPDFGKNVFISFKYFSISLPLKRVERRTKEAQSAITPVVEENLFSQVTKPTQVVPQATVTSQKKPHTRLRLNPDAPLFSNAMTQSSQSEQLQNQPGQFNPMSQMPPGFSKQGFENPQFNPQNFQSISGNMLFNTPSNFPQNISSEQPGVTSSRFPMQNQPQEYKFPPTMGRGQGQMQQASATGDFIPPGLGLSGQGMMNYPNFPPQMFQGQQGGEPSLKSRGVLVENKPQTYQQDLPRKNILEPEEEQEEQGQNILPPDLKFEDEYQQEEKNYLEEPTYQTEGTAPSILKRGRENRPANLYTAVLSGRMREDSASNSPSLQNLQNKYFSASTPRSAYEQSVDTPLSQSNEFLQEDPSNPPLSEDMIENFKLEDHLGGLVEFAKTYNGSRILQKFFPKANQGQVELVIQEIEDKLEELMLDPYANYMFQTLAQSCSGDQRYFLLKKIAPSMVEIACDRKGTHSLQALVALVSRDSEEQLLRETLQNHIVELSFDPQGTHLVQKLIVSISLNNIDFIFNPIVDRFVEVANHSFGLCVLKQLITKVDKAPELRRRIIKLLYDNLENLIQNPYGNYALQHALDVFQSDCNLLFEKTFDRIVQYSNQKFSSNVIEKCLVITTTDLKKKFVREIVKNDKIVELMKNKYGNFVLLKALKSVDTEDRQIIMQSLMRNLNSVSMAKYKNSWTKFIEENPLRIPGITPTSKPSLFRHNSGQPETVPVDKEALETTSKSLDTWNEQRKDVQKKLGDEKSQFYYGSNKEGMSGNFGDEFSKEMKYGIMENMGQLDFGDDERREFKENILEGRMGGDKMVGQQAIAGKKGAKAPNQKFYDDKNQHYQNKWGFNNFY